MATILVAYDEGRVIGCNGRMPWRIPADMRRFQDLTTGHAVIMGRKTFESLPGGPLPDRFNIVVSRAPKKNSPPERLLDAVMWTDDPNFAIEIAVKNKFKPFVIGGEAIYRYYLYHKLVHKVIATKVKGRHEGDRHFPKLHEYEGWSSEVVEVHKMYSVVEYLSLNALRRQRDDFKRCLEETHIKNAALRKERNELLTRLEQCRKKLRKNNEEIGAYQREVQRSYQAASDFIPHPDEER